MKAQSVNNFSGTTPVLTPSQRDQVMKSIFQNDGMKRTFEARLDAFKKACEKFGLKIKVSRKGTYDERYTLSTNWDNCDDVLDYIQGLGVSIGSVNGKVEFVSHYCDK